MNIRLDTNAKEVSEEQIVTLLDSGVAGTIGSRPSYHVKPGDEIASVFGAGPYYAGSEDGEGGLVLTAQDEPGDWLCWLVKELDVAVYGPGMRVVDFTWHLVPLHDSHARFTRAVYEMTARVE